MKKNTKRIIGAVVPFIIIELLFILILSAIIHFQVKNTDEMPLLFYIFIIIYLLIPIICLIVTVISRIKEIKSGEEEEASKY